MILHSLFSTHTTHILPSKLDDLFWLLANNNRVWTLTLTLNGSTLISEFAILILVSDV